MAISCPFDAARRLAWLLAVALALLAGCGGGNDGSSPNAPRQPAAAAPAAAAIGADALFDWAQLVFAPLFPSAGGAPPTQWLPFDGAGYQVRIYGDTGNILGVRDDGSVWGYGSFTGQRLVGFGALGDFTCLVAAGLCPATAPDRCQTQVDSGFAGDLNATYGRDNGGDGSADGDGGSAGVGGSEGKVLGARIRVVRLADGAVLGQGLTDPVNGLATVRWCAHDLPVLLELQGAPGAQYFDESAHALVPFPLMQRLRALVDRFDENVGVSALTEAGYVHALNRFGADAADIAAGRVPLRTDGVPLGLTAAQVRQANAAVLQEVNRQFTDALQQPSMKALGTPVDAGSSSRALPNNRYGRAAALHGGFAKIARGYHAGTSTPALALSAQLAADLSDGVLNGVTLGGRRVAEVGQTTYKSTEASVDWTIGQGQLSAQFGQGTTSTNGERVIDATRIYLDLSLGCQEGRGGRHLGWFSLTQGGDVLLKDQASPTAPCWGAADMQVVDRGRVLQGVKRLLSNTVMDHVYALSADGDLYAWGWGACGRLGNGDTGDRFSTAFQRIQQQVVKVQTAAVTTLTLSGTGEVFSWGLDYAGLLGQGDIAAEPRCASLTQFFSPTPPYPAIPVIAAPRRIGGLSRIVDIALNDSTAAAVADDGSLYAWGWRSRADATTEIVRSPQRLATVPRAVKLSSTNTLTNVLTSDGQVHVLWGLPIEIFSDGPAASFTPPKRLVDMTDVVDIASDRGFGGNMALRRDGQVYVWGSYCCTSTGVPVDRKPALGSAFPMVAGGKAVSGRLPRIVRVVTIGQRAVAVGADGQVYSFYPGYDGTTAGWFVDNVLLAGPSGS